LWSSRWLRKQVVAFFEALPSCQVGMELDAARRFLALRADEKRKARVPRRTTLTNPTEDFGARTRTSQRFTPADTKPFAPL